MKRESAKNVVLYYKAVPGMILLLRREREELEDAYNSLRGSAVDGLPRGEAKGKPTEALAVRTAERGIPERMWEIDERIRTLEADAATIRRALDALGGKYKQLLTDKLLREYSWAKIAASMRKPDSTVRYWYRMALDALGKALEETGAEGSLECRASRARTL